MNQRNSIPTDMSPYLSGTSYMDINHGSIRNKVKELVSDESPREKAVKLFYFVRDEIRYNPFAPMLTPEDYIASTILKRGYGFCIQKAVLLGALARSAGIPSRLSFADLRNYKVPGNLLELMGTNLFTYHGYNLFYIARKWVKATPAFDRLMCEKHGFRTVEFDGTTDAIFPSTTLSGEKHIEYVRDIGEYTDLPYDDIMLSFAKVYRNVDPKLYQQWMKNSQEKH